MSGKFEKKPKKNKLKIVLMILVVAAVALAGIMLLDPVRKDEQPESTTQAPSEISTTEQTLPETTAAPTETDATEIPEVEGIFDLGNGVTITELRSFTGAFMEDRTDEVVSDVLAIQVTNAGEEYIQLMDITLTSGETKAEFSLSTLFPGESVIVLEKNRMAYSTAPEFDQAAASSVARFEKHPGMCEDKVKIQCLNGVINVTNISDTDITGDILIYYKNYVSGLYYGGITYRIRVSGGLKAGAIYQGTAAHFNPSNSKVVFVTCQ